MTRPRVPVQAFRGRIPQTSCSVLPRFRARPEPGEEAGESVFAFPLKRAPLVVLIGAGGWCLMATAEFAATYYATNHPAREVWGRHANKWLQEERG